MVSKASTQSASTFVVRRFALRKVAYIYSMYLLIAQRNIPTSNAGMLLSSRNFNLRNSLLLSTSSMRT